MISRKRTIRPVLNLDFKTFLIIKYFNPVVIYISHCKRVGHVVPGVVVYLSFHAWVGWVSEIKYGLIAAARGAFTN